MKRPVFWTHRARDDLDAVFAFIAQENETAALRTLERIRKTAFLLGEHSVGRPGRVEGTYEKSVAGLPYILCFTVHTDAMKKESVVIIHVIHTARR